MLSGSTIRIISVVIGITVIIAFCAPHNPREAKANETNLQPVDSSIGMCLSSELDVNNPERYQRDTIPFGDVESPTMCDVVVDKWHRAHSDGCIVRMHCGETS